MIELRVADRFKELNEKNPNLIPAVVIASVVLAAGLLFPTGAVVVSAGAVGLGVYMMWDKMKGGLRNKDFGSSPPGNNSGNEELLNKRSALDVTDDERRPVADPNAPSSLPSSSD